MAHIKTELTELNELKKRLSKADMTEIYITCSKRLASRLYAEVVKNTPTVSTKLKKGWRVSKNAPVVRKGKKYTVTIKNPVEYASYVEYGHRTPNHKGWVDGQFMLTNAETLINAHAEQIIRPIINKKLKELMK